MESRPSPAAPAPALEALGTPAEDLPGLYRAILERVVLLERRGEREEAARIRLAATTTYSAAWDAPGLHRLLALLARVDRALEGDTRSRVWLPRRKSVPAR